MTGRAAKLISISYLTVCRYVQLWQRLGHETVAIRPPTSSILIPPVGDWVARDFMQKLQTAGGRNPRQPVVFHAFRWLLSCSTLHRDTVWHGGLGTLDQISFHLHCASQSPRHASLPAAAMQASCSLARCCGWRRYRAVTVTHSQPSPLAARAAPVSQRRSTTTATAATVLHLLTTSGPRPPVRPAAASVAWTALC